MADEPRDGEQEVPSRRTRVGFAFALALLALILVVSSQSPPPPEARLGGRVELVQLINEEQRRNERLADTVEELAGRLSAIERDLGADTAEIVALQTRVDELAAPAGLTPLAGPGVVVTLSDSSTSPAPDGDVNDYVIHEEDLQAVINALWSGGAEAMSVNGQRVLATTAIRCVGNVLLLHGSTHSPPYEIAAVGDHRTLRDALARDPAVERFANAVQRFSLGYEVAVTDELLLPAYEGPLALQRAEPVTGAG